MISATQKGSKEVKPTARRKRKWESKTFSRDSSGKRKAQQLLNTPS
jgi:hypothetical protein